MKWLVLPAVVLASATGAAVVLVDQQCSMPLCEGGEADREVVLHHVPVGTPAAEARRVMESHGFRCRQVGLEIKPLVAATAVSSLGSPPGYGAFLAAASVYNQDFKVSTPHPKGRLSRLLCDRRIRTWPEFVQDPATDHFLRVAFLCENGIVKGVEISTYYYREYRHGDSPSK